MIIYIMGSLVIGALESLKSKNHLNRIVGDGLSETFVNVP